MVLKKARGNESIRVSRNILMTFLLTPVLVLYDLMVEKGLYLDPILNECGLCNFELSYIADFLGQGKAHPQKNKVK